MKTAEVILENEWNKNKNNCPFNEIYIGEKIAINNAMIEFAKMHVQEALEKAYLDSEMRVSENDTNEYPSFTDNYDDGYVTITVSKDSILNAYPLENII